MTTPSRLRRNDVVDGFRGIAIVSVMAFHYTVRWAPPLEPENVYGYDQIFPELFRIGAYGVHLFFVISGLVITMTLLRSASVSEFAVRRIARIYPAFLVAAATTFILMQFGPDRFRVGVWDFVSNLLIDARMFGNRPIDGVYWSLAVEIKFYAIVMLARAILADMFWAGLLAFAVLSVALLQVDARIATALLLAPYWPFFLLGVAAWFWVFDPRPTAALSLFAGSLLLYLATYPENHQGGVQPLMVDSALALTVFCLLAALNARPNVRVPLLAPLGRVSYSLYLLHQNIGVSIIAALKALGWSDLAAILVAGSAMITAATFFFYYIEQPGTRLVMLWYRSEIIQAVVRRVELGTKQGER